MPVCSPWFISPIIGLVLMVAVLFLVFGRRGPFAHVAGRGGWGEHGPGASGGDSALDIPIRRYARGELTKEQFEQMRRDVA